MNTSVIDSTRRCPRCSKLLVVDAGQDENWGDLRVRLYCLNDEWEEFSNPNAEAARRHSAPVRSAAERLRALRLEGVVVPLVIDHEPFPEVEIDA
jgi:hypothetical protein